MGMAAVNVKGDYAVMKGRIHGTVDMHMGDIFHPVHDDLKGFHPFRINFYLVVFQLAFHILTASAANRDFTFSLRV